MNYNQLMSLNSRSKFKMTSTRMFAIDVVEFRGSKKLLKLKKKLTTVLVDATFEDVLLNLEHNDTRYKICRIELKTFGSSINAFHCEVDQKIQEVLEFDSNFKIMSIILIYDETGGQEEGLKRQDGLKLMSNARALERPKKKKETKGEIFKLLHFVNVFFIRKQ